MNENERRVATDAYERASAALAETQAELKEAKSVVAEWSTLPTMKKEYWDEAKSEFKNKTLDGWKKEVEKLEKQKEKDEQREMEARAAFVTKGNYF